MRQERNQQLKDCDFRVIPDYTDTNKEAWYYIDTIYASYLKLGAKTTQNFQLNQNK